MVQNVILDNFLDIWPKKGVFFCNLSQNYILFNIDGKDLNFPYNLVYLLQRMTGKVTLSDGDKSDL